MKNIQLITVTSDPENEGCQNLINSVNKFKWPFILIEAKPWRGFCTKVIETYKLLKDNPQIDGFFFCDANDVVVLGTLQEAYEKLEANYGTDKLVASAERGCWPRQDWEKNYVDRFDHRFNYLNSGLYYSPSELFINLVESYMPAYEDDDQKYLTEIFLFDNLDRVVLDNNCEVFQSYSFIDPDDYAYSGTRLHNLKTGTEAPLVHGNGRQDMTKVLELLK
jgi:hypothetical protein